MRLWRFMVFSFSLALRRELAFRVNLVIELCMNVVGIGAGLTTLGVIYTHTALLTGWSHGEMIVLLGTFQIISALLATFITPNLNWFSERVKNGSLDQILLQPLSSLFMASLGSCAPLALSQFFLGTLVVGIGIHTLGIVPSPIHWLIWLAFMGAGMVVTWATRVLLACISFWAPATELDGIYNLIWEFARYPIDIYREPLRFGLTYLIPMVFIATWPTQALTRSPQPILLLIAIAVSVGIILLVVATWRRGLRHYISAIS